MENTGKYGWLLIDILSEMDYFMYVVNPIHLKKSLGLIRGKNDKIDAFRIAQFIKKNYQELPRYEKKSAAVMNLQVLLSERQHKVKQRKCLLIKQKDYLLIENLNLQELLIAQNQQLISEIANQIKVIEKEIKQEIKQEQFLKDKYDQMTSVPGVGKVLAWNLLVKTNAFININDPRKLACFAGVAPFENRSGSSVFGKSRVSLFADKQLKTLLHMASISAVKSKNDIQLYFLRKIEQGKNKMCVLNAVRNKIIHIICALIRNQSFFQNRLVLS
jgi:transposase